MFTWKYIKEIMSEKWMLCNKTLPGVFNFHFWIYYKINSKHMRYNLLILELTIEVILLCSLFFNNIVKIYLNIKMVLISRH